MFKGEGIQTQIKESQHRVYSRTEKEPLYTMVSPIRSLQGSMWNTPQLSHQRKKLRYNYALNPARGNKMKQMPRVDWGLLPGMPIPKVPTCTAQHGARRRVTGICRRKSLPCTEAVSAKEMWWACNIYCNTLHCTRRKSRIASLFLVLLLAQWRTNASSTFCAQTL